MSNYDIFQEVIIEIILHSMIELGVHQFLTILTTT